MKTLQQLYNGFFLDITHANSQISGCETPLWVAPIKKVNKYEGLEIDYEHFAFAEKDKSGKMEYFHGLKNFLRIEKGGLPSIFIFDNHNHAITFWYNIIYNKKVSDVELIHIDQHSDCRENEDHLKLNWNKNELGKVFDFCNQKCNVGNFIPPAIKSEIVASQVQIRSTTALENLKIDKNQNFILDIDLDFCLDGIDKNRINKGNVNLLKKKFDEFGKYALGITIATSPYFLEQELAIYIIQKLFS